jgi:hypothetical protein
MRPRGERRRVSHVSANVVDDFKSQSLFAEELKRSPDMVSRTERIRAPSPEPWRRPARPGKLNAKTKPFR